MIFVLLVCAVAGVLIYVVAVRPFFVPLEKRIPTGRQYRPAVGLARRQEHGAVAGMRRR